MVVPFSKHFYQYEEVWISCANLFGYELSKSGKLLFNHSQGTHDDRFWALAVYAAELETPSSIPIARVV